MVESAFTLYDRNFFKFGRIFPISLAKMNFVTVSVLNLVLICIFLCTPEPGSCSLPRLPAKLLAEQRFRFFHAEDANKIVGGTQALAGQIPYQVSLQRVGFSGDYRHFCGGALVGSTCVVTASHCVDGRSPEDLVVFLGSNVLYENSSKPLIVSDVRSNPAYDRNTVQNDVAILKLKEPVTFSEHVKPIGLPATKDQEVAAGTKSTVSGWGTTTENGLLSHILLYTEVPVVSDKSCQANYGQDQIFSSMLCAGTPEGGKDSCQGDSGGPLVSDDKLIGIVSWGFGCARPNYPGVYTQVSYFLDFIEKSCK